MGADNKKVESKEMCWREGGNDYPKLPHSRTPTAVASNESVREENRASAEWTFLNNCFQQVSLLLKHR